MNGRFISSRSLSGRWRLRRSQVTDWPVTEGAPGGGRFSPLTEITRENVAPSRGRVDAIGTATSAREASRCR